MRQGRIGGANEPEPSSVRSVRIVKWCALGSSANKRAHREYMALLFKRVSSEGKQVRRFQTLVHPTITITIPLVTAFDRAARADEGVGDSRMIMEKRIEQGIQISACALVGAPVCAAAFLGAILRRPYWLITWPIYAHRDQVGRQGCFRAGDDFAQPPRAGCPLLLTRSVSLRHSTPRENAAAVRPGLRSRRIGQSHPAHRDRQRVARFRQSRDSFSPCCRGTRSPFGMLVKGRLHHRGGRPAVHTIAFICYFFTARRGAGGSVAQFALIRRWRLYRAPDIDHRGPHPGVVYGILGGVAQSIAALICL